MASGGACPWQVAQSWGTAEDDSVACGSAIASPARGRTTAEAIEATRSLQGRGQRSSIANEGLSNSAIRSRNSAGRSQSASDPAWGRPVPAGVSRAQESRASA